MNFKKQLPEWNNPGTKPPQTKINEGWLPDDRPPADWWNWKDNLTFEALKELQENAVHKGEVTTKEPTFNAGAQTVNAAIKSPVNVKRIDGKTIVNLPPLFDSGAWIGYNSTFTVITPNEIKITPTTDSHFVRVDLPAKGGNTYNISAILGSGAVFGIDAIDNVGTIINASGGGSVLPLKRENPASTAAFTLPSTAAGLRIYLAKKTGADAETATVKAISLVEGTQAQPFVANVKGLTNPTIANETNGTSLVVPTTLYDGEYVEQNVNGELVKYKKWQEVILDGSLNWEFDSAYSGYKRIRIKGINGAKVGNEKIIKFNGTILETYPLAPTKADQGTLYTNELYISVSNADSGWGPNYVPTPEEIKAFLLGWRMYDGTLDPVNAETPYNNTANVKAWRWIHIIPNVATGATTTLPTVMANRGSGWQPYRLIYELATPVQEVIQPYSDLTLEKGENSVKVYAGRIVNEKVSPKYLVDNSSWYIADSASFLAGSKLVYAPEKIRRISRNGQDNTKSWNIYFSQTNMQGLEKANIHNVHFDQTASYTVDYEPLYTWEVTAPIDNVQLQYFETLVAVTNELVHDVAKQQDTVKRMLENVVNEDTGIVWIRPTLLNGLTFVNAPADVASYGKDSDGTVYVELLLQGTVTAGGTMVFTLPKGYRPSKNLIKPCAHYTDSSTIYAGAVAVYESGGVQFINNYANNKSTHVVSFSFKAEK